MNKQINSAGEQLENAFQLFNQFSEKLAGSYSDLENHVAQLSKELAQVRNERLIQLAEKEVLAKRLEGLLDALPAGIVVLDADGGITQTNPVAREMLALNANDALINKNKWEIVAANNLITDADGLRLTDGRRVNVTACPLDDDPGKIILISDISETHSLQKMLNRQQRLSSLGEMVASLAHQIRTPLSSAMLYINTLNHPANNADDRHRFADRATERLLHLERMVNDMLVFARGDVLQSEHINPAEFIAQIEKTIEPQYQAEHFIIEIDEKLNNVTIRANRDALSSVIQNIIDNAIQSCDETPRIQIKASLNDAEQFQLEITDNGCGMSEVIQERVLEPFFTTKPNGTGLGLAVVSESLNRYNAGMKIYSKEGIGSSFIIKFPRAEVTGVLPSNLSSEEKTRILTKAGHSLNKRAMEYPDTTYQATNSELKAIVAQEVEL